jgi:hypothetical protein
MNKIIIRLSSLQEPDREWLKSARPDLCATVGNQVDVSNHHELSAEEPVCETPTLPQLPANSTPLFLPTQTPSNIPFPLLRSSSLLIGSSNPTPLSPSWDSSPITLSLSPFPSYNIFSPTTALDSSFSSLSPIRSEAKRKLSEEDEQEDDNDQHTQKPPKQPKISHDNNDNTRHKFRFKKNAKRKLTQNKQTYGYRHHYICVKRSSTGCEAGYAVTSPTSGCDSITFNQHPHNHDPPSNPRLKESVKDKIKAQIQVNASTATIQKECILSSPDLSMSSADVPSEEQIKWLRKSTRNKGKTSAEWISQF